MDQKFIKGLELSQLFYEEAVGPILASRFPGLAYSAALIGAGSDVLGFDTPQSRDHDWESRLRLFLAQADYETYHQAIDQALRQEVPPEVHNHSTNFYRAEDGITWMTPADGGPIRHNVEIDTVGRYFKGILNFDPSGDIGVVDWVSVPENSLLMLTAGRVF